MKFDEESMNVFRQAVDDFIAAGESASFELAGRVLAAARMAVDAAEEDLEDEMDELDEEGLEEVFIIRDRCSGLGVQQKDEKGYALGPYRIV